MELNIVGTQTVKKLKDDFDIQFPYLKIEVFNQPHRAYEGSAVKNIVDEQLTLDAIRTSRSNGQMMFDKSLKIKDLERILRDDFGIHVQVFRKSGNIWLETTMTDDWTLEKAEEISKEMENINN
jgi:hypothetical protein